MGREWYWGGRSTTTRRGERESPGCMSCVLQLFDFHQYQFPLHHPSFQRDSFLEEDHTIVKGFEAPRNSFESEEGPCIGNMSLSPIMKEEDLNLPMGIRLKPKVKTVKIGASKALMGELSSESITSPGTKTPNLVARLMGLDLLPGNLSPSSHSRASSRTKPEVRYDMSGTRSLPDTPRISSARRSDADPRLSLQIIKENLIPAEESDYLGRVSMTQSRNKQWRQVDENRSPSHKARRIVKQVKESVGRKVGFDITNSTTRNRGLEGEGLRIKTQKSRGFKKLGDEFSPNKPVTVTTLTTYEQNWHSPRPLSKPRPSLPPPPVQPRQASSLAVSTSGTCDKQLQPKVPIKAKSQLLQQQKVKKGSGDAFSRKTLSSNELINIAAPSFVPFKKEQLASIPQTPVNTEKTQVSKRSSQLSSSSSRTYNKQETTQTPLVHQNYNNSNNTTTTDGGTELRYVSAIVNRTGIERNSLVSITTWFSPSHLLHPSIFNHLEHSFLQEEEENLLLGHLRHRCNRKLLFHLVDEILVDILKPYLNLKPWLHSIKNGYLPLTKQNQMTGSQLFESLWWRIRRFPSANCQVLQDIDALIEKDLPDANLRKSLPFSDEGELLLFEIERYILDSLVAETAAVFSGVGEGSPK